ncbi:hypothetical protein [Enhygromyxa salina]|uniref:Uncharacterized protein n=1 Tax=Enhygromyxa salina TaxID=215803 RepID=A0A2S9Y8B4_9BACT|nr:hypothetical protein [Enhygromyxa salina]PRQ01261.1 hypothetical protein ENSA7_58660 [Enhygromyxa salina]
MRWEDTCIIIAAVTVMACGEPAGEGAETSGSAGTESSGTESSTTSSEPETDTSTDTDTGTDTDSDSDTDTDTDGNIDLGPPVIRVNVGGPAIAEFLADDAQNSPYRFSPDTQVFAPASPIPGPTVPAELPVEVLESGRVEAPELEGGTGQLRYALPVEPGPYQLRLHFAGPSAGPGTRLAQLLIDGQPVGEVLDLSALVDGGVASSVVVEIEAEAWLDIELVRVPGSEMPLLSAFELFGAGALRDGPDGAVFHITPAGAGSGASLEDAAGLAQLPGLIAAAAPGDELWIHAGMGDYMTNGELAISAGGSEAAPIVIRGVGADWHDHGRPRFVGSRADPWTPDGATGGTVFRLQPGADHLHFINLDFANQGNGVWRTTGNLEDLHIENVVARNVHRLVEDYAGGGESESTITDLILKDVSVRGYARAVARLQYSTHDVLIEDVFGDSESQQYESFSTGLTFYEFAHDAVVRRTVMLNHRQLDVEGYWNADGFSSERDNTNLRFEDTYAAGNTDGGYDLKSTQTTLVRAIAVDNKRNFRFWGQGEFVECVGLDPNQRGGSGTQAQLHVVSGAQLQVSNSRFQDDDASTIVFDIDDDGVAIVTGGCAQHHPQATLQTVEAQASLDLEDVAPQCP